MIQSGDADTDGITIVSPIELNSGTLRDPAGNNADRTYTVPDLSNVRVDTSLPSVTAVVKPADATYVNAETISFTVSFSENVSVTNTPSSHIECGWGHQVCQLCGGIWF